MKKLVIYFFLILSYPSFAIDAYTIIIPQVDPTGNFQINRLIAKPSSDGYLKYSSSTNLPVWETMSTITMTSTQISDTSSIGRDLMTAADASAARTAIGAGSSNFSGNYNDLSGRPTNLSQFTNNTGFITASTAPVTSVNTKTGALTLNHTDVGAAASSHTHQATDLSDSTSVGRSLVTASTQALARSAIGAGTSSFTPSGTSSQCIRGDGSYGSCGSTRSFSNPTRALNSCFQVSSTRDAIVVYAAEITASLALVGGQQGTLYLETFTDSGCTTGTQEIVRSTNGNTSALIVAVGNVSTTTLTVSGVVPSGLYVKLRTQNNTGTPTFVARPGQEVLL